MFAVSSESKQSLTNHSPNTARGRTARPSPGLAARMQSSCGNQAVLRALDRNSSGLVQRECSCGGAGASGGCPECATADRKPIARLAQNGSRRATVPASVYGVIGSRGDSMDKTTRGFMETRFGYDFGGVEIHTDRRAADSAREVNALAYTVGNHVVFGASQYQPQTETGKLLLAHELTHTIQQGAVNPGAGLTLGDPDARSEHEAASTASSIVKGASDSNIRRFPEDGLQRQEDEMEASGPDTAADDGATPDDARKALVDIVGEDRLKDLEDMSPSPQDQEAASVATQVMRGGSLPWIARTVGSPELMTAGAAAIIGAVLAAAAICATGWFFYTENKYGKKGDKWKHCYCGCKIATYCGGPVMSTLIGAGKEVADGVMDFVGIPAMAEWEDFVADEEGAWLCAVGHFFTSCYSCCSKKRP